LPKEGCEKLKVFKEVLIIIIIIVSVIGFNFLIQNYLESSSEEIIGKLEETSNKLMETRENVDYEKITKDVSELEAKWYEMEKIWMLILLHSDLDMIDRTFKNLFSYIDTKDFEGTYRSVKELKFLIEYIAEKDAFTLKNIF